jgi:asparagine synthetase B (glutamine-hydrolysing)
MTQYEQIAEEINKIPSKLKYADGREKYLLRQVAKKYLPDYIINRKKLGFPDLPDGRDLLVSRLIKTGSLKKSELIQKMFSSKLFDNIENLPFSAQWKLCSIALLEGCFNKTI